ncbi:MAG: hypothetical protein Ct9H300mP28_08570 [Pseudomonadota bacterium]|nr:MAG: hypothetical protein Ct9H300mP28_08570 [Pseudomonadota bacterium]
MDSFDGPLQDEMREMRGNGGTPGIRCMRNETGLFYQPAKAPLNLKY